MKFDSESMRKGPIFKSVIIYTVPIILTSILQLLFNAADLIVVGWFSGSDSVAAVGATGSLTNLIVCLLYTSRSTRACSKNRYQSAD